MLFVKPLLTLATVETDELPADTHVNLDNIQDLGDKLKNLGGENGGPTPFGDMDEESIAKLIASMNMDGGGNNGMDGMFKNVGNLEEWDLDEADMNFGDVKTDIFESYEDEEVFEFKAETSRLMDIIINNLYSGKEIFVRELISNAIDALEKSRVDDVVKKTEPAEQYGVYIESLELEDGSKAIRFMDSGVGMSKDELINNLGTIAKSGSAAFEGAGSDVEVASIVGQFGVGFYSAYLVASEVIVESKQMNGEAYLWHSKSGGQFSIAKSKSDLIKHRGTSIVLKLKEDSVSFGETSFLTKLVKEYSGLMTYPIFIKNKAGEYKHANPVKPIWQSKKGDVTDEERAKFYKSISKDHQPFMDYIHFHGEGGLEFTTLLFIQDHPQMFHSAENAPDNVTLYVKNVQIPTTNEKIVPYWLNFVHGVVEANELPLKVDRENLTNSKELKVIKKRIVNLVLDKINVLYKDFKAEVVDNPEVKEEESKHAFIRLESYFSQNMFLACTQEIESIRNKLFKFLRFRALRGVEQETTEFNSVVTLEDRVKELDEAGFTDEPIYFMWNPEIKYSGDNPILETLWRSKKSVLFLETNAAERCFSSLGTYKGHKIVSVENAINDILKNETEEDGEYMTAARKMMQPMFDEITPLIKDRYKAFGKFELTNKLINSPAAIYHSQMLAGHQNMVGQDTVSASQEKYIKTQDWWDENLMGDQIGKKVLQLNIAHPSINSVWQTWHESGADAKDKVSVIMCMLYDYAILSGNFILEESFNSLASSLRNGINHATNIKEFENMTEEEAEAGYTNKIHVPEQFFNTLKEDLSMDEDDEDDNLAEPIMEDEL